MKFKKGDKAVCISFNTGLTKGKKYVVVDIANNTRTNMIAIIDDNDEKYFYSSRRFITLQEQKENLKLMLSSKVR